MKMAYTPYYAPYQRPMMYYNPSIPQEAQQMQSGQPYGQPIQQPQMQQPMQIAQPTPTNDMIWVLSEVEAQSYPVAPNNSVILWDKNNDVIYIKSANIQGVPSMRILDYTERTADNATKSSEKHECKCGSKFVSIDSFNALQRDFEALRNELRNMKEKQITKDMTFSEVNDGE
jgi:hypothetical protein